MRGRPDLDELSRTTYDVAIVGAGINGAAIARDAARRGLSVVVVDQLPSQLSYAANLSSSCGVGAPVVNGQTLTFPAFNLADSAITVGACLLILDALLESLAANKVRT